MATYEVWLMRLDGSRKQMYVVVEGTGFEEASRRALGAVSWEGCDWQVVQVSVVRVAA